jgi:hypothetical protein
MEHTESSINPSAEISGSPAIASQTLLASSPGPEHVPTRATLIPQSEGELCPKCAGAAESHAPPSYVYAVGKIEWRFPNKSVEKEFAQVTGLTETAGQTDQEAFHTVLSQRQNRYLVRQLCWVLTIEGLETYILSPRDPADIDLLIEAVRPAPSPLDMDIVIGMRGPIASPELCNGLMIPIVVFDQIYSFDRIALIRSIPRPEAIDAARFSQTCEQVFDCIMQLADNAGATDEHRALNYLTVRYPKIYETTAEAYGRSCSLTAVEAQYSRLSSTGKIVDVIFTYANRSTDFTEKYFVRVDVTEKFPFLVTKMSPYYDR